MKYFGIPVFNKLIINFKDQPFTLQQNDVTYTTKQVVSL